MSCRRVWEAGAIEDGRLDAPSIASFERHMSTCAECARARDDLAKLRDAGRAHEPRRLTPFEHRRNRAELLRRANAEALRPPRRAPAVALLFAAAAILAAFIVYHVEQRTIASARSTHEVSVQRPRFELRPIGGAEWHDASAGPSGRVVLATGTLGIHVEHLAPGQRFVLALPDGELEVHGTRFIVEAKSGRTERVLVTEGVVSLRLRDLAPRTLTAGESYVPPSLPPARASAAVDEAPVSSRAAPAPRPSAERNRTVPKSTTVVAGSTAPPATGTPAAESASSPPAATDEVAGAAFHSAMAAFNLGAYADADERFAEFMGRFASDSRCEDAAFLRTVIALRRGDPAAAVVRARTYLRRYPNGLRRREMERMLDEAKAPGQADVPPR